MLEIVRLGDDILRKSAEPVKEIDEDLGEFLAGMFDALHFGNGVGLAAPQVSRSWRIFITNAQGDKQRVFINPSIVLTSQEEIMYEEGCLSLPGAYAEIKRPEFVTVQAWNEKGKPFTLDADGLLARVIQHEYDHLNGILFIDHLSPIKRERVVNQYEKRIRV